MASLGFLFLGVGSMFKLRRGSFPADLLRTEREVEPWSAGDRFSICDRKPSSMGDLAGLLLSTGDERGPFVLGAAAFLPFGLITLSGTFRLASAVGFVWNSGRPELSVNKVSGVRLR